MVADMLVYIAGTENNFVLAEYLTYQQLSDKMHIPKK